MNMFIWNERWVFHVIPKIFSFSEILMFLSICSLNHNSACLQRFAVSGHSSSACTVVSTWSLQYRHSFVFGIFILCSNCLVFSLSCNILNCTYLLYTHFGIFGVILKAFWISSSEMSSFNICSHFSFRVNMMLPDLFLILVYIVWQPLPLSCMTFNMYGNIGWTLLLLCLTHNFITLGLIFAYSKKLTPIVFGKYVIVTKLPSVNKSFTNLIPLLNHSLLKYVHILVLCQIGIVLWMAFSADHILLYRDWKATITSGPFCDYCESFNMSRASWLIVNPH